MSGITNPVLYKVLRPEMLVPPSGRNRKRDYLSATEVDPNSRITVAKNLLTFTGLTRSEAAYAYDDFDSGHFSGNFSHLIGPVNVSAVADAGIIAFWVMANDIANPRALQVGEKDHLWIYLIRSGADYSFYLREHNFDTHQEDPYTTTSALIGTDYWFEVYRDESVGTYGTLYCRIYSDVGLNTLVDTLSLTLTKKKDFRYLYYIGAYDDTNAAACTGTIGGLIINQ